MKHSEAFKKVLEGAIHYLQTPEGKKEFEDNRRNSIDLQAMIYEEQKKLED
jgi:hypothetical protein